MALPWSAVRRRLQGLGGFGKVRSDSKTACDLANARVRTSSFGSAPTLRSPSARSSMAAVLMAKDRMIIMMMMMSDDH